jgi:hypothetical protein
LGVHLGIVPHAWVKVAAVAGILEMILVAWWARKNHRLSISLSLFLVGNMLVFGSILLPMSLATKETLLNVGVGLFVLSFVARLSRLLGLIAKKD